MSSSRARLAALALALCACNAGSAGGGGRSAPPPPGGGPDCAGHAAPFADHLLVGFSGTDATGRQPGFGLRYLYLAGELAPDATCYDLARSNAVGCGEAWWGTWQYDQLPPGQYPLVFADRATADGQLPMITYYMLLQAYEAEHAGFAEGTDEITVAMRDRAFMTRYLADFRFFLQRLGGRRAIVHVEPDLWGYAHRAGPDPAALPAEISAAAPGDCGHLSDSVAGFGRCLVALARRHAPNVLVALHGSPWATGHDAILNADPSLDVAAVGRAHGAFLEAAGAATGDLIVVDMSDRDAGWYQAQGQNTWLDPLDAQLPSFTQAFAWSRALATRLGRPLVWWQVPVGNAGLPDRAWTQDGELVGAWRDNRVQYLLDHPDRVADSGAVAVTFGAGLAGQTTPETDGGELVRRTAALHARGGQPLCAR